jgi:general secretion pathway protein K
MWQKVKMRQPHNVYKSGTDERGAVLLVVSLILALISILILSWAREWRTELALTSNFLEVRQSRRLAEAGVFYALGKLATARSQEVAAKQTAANLQLKATTQDVWRLDQQPRLLEFPGGQAEVRIADEGGKFNLNQVSEEILFRLFKVLGLSELKTRTMVDSILDWRTRGDQPRPYGAKSSYCLRLEPPYVAQNGRFETVTELAWVRGFEDSPLVPRLTDLLTVQTAGAAINLNTAPSQVLQAAGFSPAAAEALIAARQQAPVGNLIEVERLFAEPLMLQKQKFLFASSLFFTIKSAGMVKNGKGPYIVKAIVKLQPNQPTPWEIIAWMDDFPG